MPVFFGRDLSRFSEFLSVWYGTLHCFALLPRLVPSPSCSSTLTHSFQLPVKILYPQDYLPTPNVAQSSLIDKFVKGLKLALQVSREEISLAELWKRDCPDGPDHADISEYLKLVIF